MPTMTEQKEHYLHFCSCIEWLNECWRLLKLIETQRENPLRGPAFRFALIQYCKPYSPSFGNIKKGQYKLEKTHIPKDKVSLHDRILDSRNQIQAHLDLRVMDAKVHIHEFMGERYSLIPQNKIDGAEELRNITEIIALIESTLDSMYEESTVLLAALEPDGEPQ